jgi:hypothetical protein
MPSTGNDQNKVNDTSFIACVCADTTTRIVCVGSTYGTHNGVIASNNNEEYPPTVQATAISQVDFQIKGLMIFPFSFYFKTPDSLWLLDPCLHLVRDGRIHQNFMLAFQNTFDLGQKVVDSYRELVHRE